MKKEIFCGEEEKEAKIFGEENIFFVYENKNGDGKGGKYLEK